MPDTPSITHLSSGKPPYHWGVDVGGTGIKVGLVDDSGQTMAFETLATRESDGPTAAMQRVATVIGRLEDQLGISGHVPRIGLGAPGPMDVPRGYLLAPPQLPSWWDFPIRDTIAKLLDRPVSFLNDANAAAYGEFWLGTGQSDASMILLTLGTGVGGGIIVDGELVDGVNSFAGEFGHILVDPSPGARLCAWGGGRGQLEAYASASGVVGRVRERLADGAASSLGQAVASDEGELTAKKVYEAGLAGDSVALEIIDETARWLGVGVTTLVHTLDPGAVVLGGAMDFGGSQCALGQRFLRSVAEEFRSHTFENIYRGTTIQFASLGARAGYLGLAGFARKESLRV